jgi:hypothetical protein
MYLCINLKLTVLDNNLQICVNNIKNRHKRQEKNREKNQILPYIIYIFSAWEKKYQVFFIYINETETRCVEIKKTVSAVILADYPIML